MATSDVDRSFAVPVFFLLAGMVLVMLAVAWITVGTGPIMAEGAPTDPAPTRPWLPAIATVVALASLTWGFRKLRQPAP